MLGGLFVRRILLIAQNASGRQHLNALRLYIISTYVEQISWIFLFPNTELIWYFNHKLGLLQTYHAWKSILTIWQKIKGTSKITISQLFSELGRIWKYNLRWYWKSSNLPFKNPKISLWIGKIWNYSLRPTYTNFESIDDFENFENIISVENFEFWKVICKYVRIHLPQK